MSKIGVDFSDDPKDLFDKLAGIRRKFSSVDYIVSEEELMAIVLDKAPAEYAAVLAQVQINQGINLTVVHLKYAMKTQWRLQYKKSVKKRSDLSLSAFNGTRYKCGENSHKENESSNKMLPAKEKGFSRFFLGKCKNCGKIGHKSADNWEITKNKDKINSGYKNAGEKGLLSKKSDDSGNELLSMEVDDNYKFGFMTLRDDTTFASDIPILRDPNIFIAGTGATSDIASFLYVLQMSSKKARNIQSLMHLVPRLVQVNVGH